MEPYNPSDISSLKREEGAHQGSTPLLRPGTRIGNCEIVTRLRTGGMATLYLARRTGAGGFCRYVAIKVINRELASDKEFTRMFLNEARLGARVLHPNVANIEELGEFGATHYLVLEYVHGCSLLELTRALRLAGKKLPTELAVQIAIQCADGLHAAHEIIDESGTPLGLVHCDVSPENILLSYAGAVKLIDFGIARAIDAAPRKGALQGKYRYMSPEQARGEILDRRSDVFSLGVVLWELLTGQSFFGSENQFSALEMIRNVRPTSPRNWSLDVPSSVDEVVMRALEPDRGTRLGTALQFRQRLAAAMPAAAALDSPRLSCVLKNALSKHIETERTRLPSGLWQSPVIEPLPCSPVGLESLPDLDETTENSRRRSLTRTMRRAPQRAIAFATAGLVAALGTAFTLYGLADHSPQTISLPASTKTPAPHARPHRRLTPTDPYGIGDNDRANSYDPAQTSVAAQEHANEYSDEADRVIQADRRSPRTVRRHAPRARVARRPQSVNDPLLVQDSF